MFVDNIPANPIGHINTAFQTYCDLKPLFKKIKQAVKAGQIKRAMGAEKINSAKEAKVITADEATKLLEYNEQLMSIIHVDHFDEKELVRKKPAATRKRAPSKKTSPKKPTSTTET